LIAAESVERLRQDDVELIAHRSAKHGLNARAHQCGARNRRVAMLFGHYPTMPRRELSAISQLVRDGRSPANLQRAEKRDRCVPSRPAAPASFPHSPSPPEKSHLQAFCALPHRRWNAGSAPSSRTARGGQNVAPTVGQILTSASAT